MAAQRLSAKVISMSRGHGERERALLDQLADGRWHDVVTLAGEGATRGTIESVRRAVKRLADEGTVVLRYRVGQANATRLQARLRKPR